MFDPELIEDLPGDLIDDVGDGLRLAVESDHRREDGGTEGREARYRFQVALRD